MFYIIFMRQFFHLAILTYFFISCNTEISSKSKGFKNFVIDTMRLTPHNEIDLSRIRAKEFNLPGITNGVDSFELRIWVSSMLVPEFATIIRYSDSQWIAHEYTYYKNGSTLDSVIMRKMNLTDSIGNVVSYLSDSGVLNLPSQHAIPGFVDNVADGQSCTIEISTKTFYKALDYHCPEHFTDPFNKRFMEIVNFLNPYLQFYAPICVPTK
jgi:hypothetical protein